VKRVCIGQSDRYRAIVLSDSPPSFLLLSLSLSLSLSDFHLPSAIRLIARSNSRGVAAYPWLLPQIRHFGDAAASQRETQQKCETSTSRLRDVNFAYHANNWSLRWVKNERWTTFRAREVNVFERENTYIQLDVTSHDKI